MNLKHQTIMIMMRMRMIIIVIIIIIINTYVALKPKVVPKQQGSLKQGCTLPDIQSRTSTKLIWLISVCTDTDLMSVAVSADRVI